MVSVVCCLMVVVCRLPLLGVAVCCVVVAGCLLVEVGAWCSSCAARCLL